LDAINPTAPIFDLEKLKWLNGVYLRDLTVAELSSRIVDGGFVDQTWYQDRSYFEHVVVLAQERMRTLKEFAVDNRFFFEEFDVQPEVVSKVTKYIEKNLLEKYLLDVIRVLSENVKEWDGQSLEEQLRKLQETLGLKPKNAFMSIRLVVTGQDATPPLFETIAVLGKTITLKRIEQFITGLK